MTASGTLVAQPWGPEGGVPCKVGVNGELKIAAASFGWQMWRREREVGGHVCSAELHLSWYPESPRSC